MAKSEYILRDDLEHVYAALMPDNRRALQVAEATGLRIGDVLALRTEQLRKGQRISVRETKTGKSRRVYIPQALYAELLDNAGDEWVFPGCRDPAKHRTRQAVWTDVKRASKAFRLPQNVSPHSWRKFYAVDLWEDCGDMAKVAKALNHEPQHPDTTLLYIMAAELYRKRYQQQGSRGGRGGRRRGKG